MRKGLWSEGRARLRCVLVVAAALAAFAPTAAAQIATVTGSIDYGDTTAAASGRTKVEFRLVNCTSGGLNLPRVLGTTSIARPVVSFGLDASGNIVSAAGGSAQIYRNDYIDCGGATNSRWQVWIIYDRGEQFYAQFLINGATFNLNSAAADTSTPSPYNPSYMLLNPGGSQTVNGDVTINGILTATTNAIVSYQQVTVTRTASAGPAIDMTSGTDYINVGTCKPGQTAGFGGCLESTNDPSTTTGYGVWLTNNAYWDGTNWKQPRGSGTSSRGFTVSNHKGFSWNYAAAGGVNDGTITWTELMNLDSSGNLNLVAGGQYRISGAQISAANLSNGTTGTAGTAVVLATSPTLVTPTLGAAKATSLATSTATPALSGIVRFADADTSGACWRNNANGADKCLKKTQAVSGGISADSFDLTDFAMAKQPGRQFFSGTAPTCTFTSGGGTTPSCALQAGSTDVEGTVIATAGTGAPGSSGDLTLTFSATYGTNAPSCKWTLSLAGAGQWNARATAMDKTPATGSDVMHWDNNAVALSVSTAYHLTYHCDAK